MTQVIHGLTREQLIKRVFGETKPSAQFNFDLERMREAVESPAIKIPDEALSSFEAFDAWMMQEGGDSRSNNSGNSKKGE